MKKKETVWFWLIAIALMVVSMCVLSLQIIDLHKQKDEEMLKELQSVVPVEEESEEVTVREEEKVEPTEVAKVETPVPSIPKAVPSKRLRTPREMRRYGRILYDVPADGQCGFWALLRGLNPKDELIRREDILRLKKKAARCAAKTEGGPTRGEILRMFAGDEALDTGMLPYLAHAMGRDVVVTSTLENFGYDLFTENGETYHYDTIEEVEREVESPQTIWLHNFDNHHWTVGIPDEEDDTEKTPQEVYFLLHPED